VARGLDNPAIARELVLTSKTVRNHVSNVLAKINAGDRSQAIVLARRSGFGQAR
jgi:DNA-binding NarL/FixJ family response regulator